MKRLLALFILASALAPLFTQTQFAPRIRKGTVAQLPATCIASFDWYYGTNETAGENLYFCTATNTWTQIVGAGGSGITSLIEGTGNPNTDMETCAAPSTSGYALYYETALLQVWQCVDADTWERIQSTSGTGPATIQGEKATSDPCPADVAADQFCLYVLDSDGVLHVQDEDETESVTVIPNSGAASNVVTSISSGGVVGLTQLSCEDLADADTGCSSPSGGGSGGYVIQFGSQDAGFNPADATTYYLGLGGIGMSSQAGRTRVVFPAAGTVTECVLWVDNQGTNGTAETSTMYFRLNGTTDTEISAVVQNDQNQEQFTNASPISVAVVKGDYATIKWVTPTWSTNPLDFRMGASCYVAQ